MDRLDTEALRRIETELGRRIVAEFGLDLSGLVLDMTNFATYIDTTNDRAPIAQRGKAKQKRTDLRLVGLALVVTRDGGVPLVSHAYPGDRPDVTQFGTVIDELVARYRALDRDGGIGDRGLRRRAELRRQPQSSKTPGSGSSDRSHPATTPTCSRCRPPPTTAWTPTATPA